MKKKLSLFFIFLFLLNNSQIFPASTTILDKTFNGDGIATIPDSDECNSIAIQADQKIILAGQNASLYFTAARLNTDGTLDTSFGTNGIMTASISGASNSI